ncbi:MAG: DUF2267 domain-containing protein [Planctomycetota bacterium]
MSVTDAGALTKAIDKGREWLAQLRRDLGAETDAEALRALRATLQVLRERLPLAEVADLSAQLPVLLRGFFLEGWRPGAEPRRLRDETELLTAVQERYGRQPLDAKRAVRAVFKLLEDRISAGEIEDVKQVLPRALHGLWPQRGGAVLVVEGVERPVLEHAIGQFMSRGVLSVPAGAPLPVALDLMASARVRHLLVLSLGAPDEQPIHLRWVAGMLSNRDALGALRPGASTGPEWLLVRDVMTRAPLRSIGPDAPLRDAAGLMHELKVGSLLVIERERVVGIITSDDLLYAGSLRSAPEEARS